MEKVRWWGQSFKEYIFYRKLVNTRNMVYRDVCSAVLKFLEEKVGAENMKEEKDTFL